MTRRRLAASSSVSTSGAFACGASAISRCPTDSWSEIRLLTTCCLRNASRAHDLVDRGNLVLQEGERTEGLVDRPCAYASICYLKLASLTQPSTSQPAGRVNGTP